MRPFARFSHLLLALALVTLPALTPAQEAPAKKGKNQPAANATPAPAEKEKKPGMFSRMFGGGRQKATTPTPAPETKPTPRNRGKKNQEAEAQGDATVRPPKPAAAAPAAPAERPEADSTPTATPAPKTKREKAPENAAAAPKSKEQAAVDGAVAGGDPDAIEKAKYDEVKARAVADPKLVELREKADNAGTEEEGRKQLVAYNRALFQKMRALEPSIKERVDRMEAAVLKQLGANQ